MPWWWWRARQGREDKAPRRGGRLRLLVVVLVAGLGAVLATLLTTTVTGPVGPFDASVSLEPDWSGGTLVQLGPLGDLVVDTHDGPYRLVAHVETLRVEEAERIVRDPSSLGGIEQEIADDARAIVRRLLGRALLSAVVGGVVLALIRRFTLRSAVLGGVVGLAISGLALSVAMTTWRPTALAEPKYTGLLSFAPQAVGSAEDISRRFGEYRVQLAQLVGNLSTLYQAAEGLPMFDPDELTTRVLHVSDIHLNPQAFDLIDQLVEQFEVDAVIDSGDTTDFGTLAEARVVESIGDLSVPYVWVRGNHDSQLIQSAVAAQPNAVVLDGEAQEVAGLRVWGIGDPRFTPDKSEASVSDDERARAESFAPRVARQLEGAIPPPVDILVVHDLRTAAAAANLVPLVLAGHTHRVEQTRVGDTLALLQGSTGGAGLRGLEGEEPVPLTATVLYFDPVSDRLQAYDVITVTGLGGTGARIERHVVAASAGFGARGGG